MAATAGERQESQRETEGEREGKTVWNPGNPGHCSKDSALKHGVHSTRAPSNISINNMDIVLAAMKESQRERKVWIRAAQLMEVLSNSQQGQGNIKIFF